jgi:LAO/AO transport system kinase
MNDPSLNPANINTELLQGLQKGDTRALARCITVVENELQGYEELLLSLRSGSVMPVIGITGPPGAGKSTLLNVLIKQLTAENKKIGVICIDPTSPFNFGSLLGDRLRMAEHFTNERVFIRSLATRGSLGGLSAKIIEVVEVMKAADFDYLFVETVGVGQSEVEIAGLADLTILVLVPESGDEVQTIKSGIMEIADIFVVNKSDREGAEAFVKIISSLVHSRMSGKTGLETPVIKAVAITGEGTPELIKAIDTLFKGKLNTKRSYLLTEKAYRLIRNKRMKDIQKIDLKKQIEEAMAKPGFNLYAFVKNYS